jgi:uncharacterized membrane protein YhaH (DUF805 family)
MKKYNDNDPITVGMIRKAYYAFIFSCCISSFLILGSYILLQYKLIEESTFGISIVPLCFIGPLLAVLVRHLLDKKAK